MNTKTLLELKADIMKESRTFESEILSKCDELAKRAGELYFDLKIGDQDFNVKIKEFEDKMLEFQYRLNIEEFGPADRHKCEYPIIRSETHNKNCQFKPTKHYANMVNKQCPEFFFCKVHGKVFVYKNWKYFELGFLKEVTPKGRLIKPKLLASSWNFLKGIDHSSQIPNEIRSGETQ